MSLPLHTPVPPKAARRPPEPHRRGRRTSYVLPQGVLVSRRSLWLMGAAAGFGTASGWATALAVALTSR